MNGTTPVFPSPPGVLCIVGFDAEQVTDWNALSGYRIYRVSISEFLEFDLPIESGVNSMASVALNLTDWSGSPLSLLARARLLLSDSGTLLIRIAQGPMTGQQEHRKAVYLKALATHFGFSDMPPPLENGFGGELIALSKTDPVRWDLSQLEADDVTECMSLFRESFGAEISAELWHWKYGGGRGRAIVARRGGRLVAHYGGTTRRVVCTGEVVQGLQVCDVMVAPRERGVMTRKGAFFEVASVFLEAYFGYYDEHHLAYGFPNRRAMRVAENMGLYGEVGRIAEIRWSPLPTRVRIRYGIGIIARDQIDDGLLARLWEQMASDLKDAVAVARDPDYFRYRYLHHPQYDYDILSVTDRLTGSIRGLAVLRREKEECKLLDLLAPLKEIPLLIDAVRRQTGRWGLMGVSAWISLPFADLFANTGGEHTMTDVRIPANVWSEGPSIEFLKDRWWLMMGDSDFL